MGSPDLQTFLAELETRGWLKRVSASVDPILEISEITDRVTKAGGPALLFENVIGSDIPVAINTFGAKERMCLALDCDDFEELAQRVRLLLKPEMPATLMDKLRKVPQLVELASLPPKIVKRGLCQEVVHTDDADLTRLPAIKCWPGDGDLSANVYAHVREIRERGTGIGDRGAGIGDRGSGIGERSSGLLPGSVSFGRARPGELFEMLHGREAGRDEFVRILIAKLVEAEATLGRDLHGSGQGRRGIRDRGSGIGRASDS